MQIELRSRVRRFSFAAACLVGVFLYLQFALQAYVASHLAATLDVAKIQKAIQFEGANAEYRDLLGRYLVLSGASLDEAISVYRTAVHLNPYEAQYWLDLAGAYQIAGRTGEQADSVLQDVAEVELGTVEVEFALLDFGEIQNVID